MTAKERLLATVADLTEDQAESVLAALGREPLEWPDFPPAPPEVMEQFKRARDESERRRGKSHSEIVRKFNIR